MRLIVAMNVVTVYHYTNMKQRENEEVWGKFLELTSSISDPEDLKELFDLFFTLKEKETIIGRYLVVQALEKGQLTQREIAKMHQLSISQITRGSNALKVIDASLQEVLKKHFNETR